MKIEQGKDLVEQVRQELAALGESEPGAGYMTKAADRVGDWLQFIDEIQQQRDGLLQLRESLNYAASFIQNGKMAPRATPVPSPGRKSPIRAYGEGNTSARVRRAAAKVFNEDKAWRATGSLSDHIRRIDPSLEDVDSSRVSSAMEYAKVRGIFAAKYEGSKKLWGLPEWRKEDEETGD